MKNRYLFLLNGLIGLCFLVACTNDEPTPVTQAITTDVSLTPTSPATTTATAEPIAAAVTPSATLAATITPTATPTPLSPPTGRIIFLWDPHPIPPDDQRGEGEVARTNLYLASPGHTYDSWQIAMLVEMYGQPIMIPSPDNTKLAVMKYDDTNADGVIDPQRGVDIINIYAYALDNSSFMPLTDNQFSSLGASWLPDSQNLVYSQQNAIFLTNSQTPLANELITNDFPDNITGLTLSPDGGILAINRFPGNLDFYYMETSSTVPITGIDHGYQLNMKWSVDSQWLAITRIFNDGLFILDSNTRQVMEIYNTGLVFPVWSPNEQLLAFTHGPTLFLWDGHTKTQKELISRNYLSQPAWSPDGTQLAVGFLEGNRSGVLILNLISGDWQELNLEMTVNPIIWSPDGQWLLFSSYQENLTGLFLVNATLKQPSLFLDTTGKNFPSNVFWLENFLFEN